MTGDGREHGAPAGGSARPEPPGRPVMPDRSGKPSKPERPEGAMDSVGEYLARQRRLRGITIDELCERTRIPRRNIERLEAGAFDEQRDGFARGFVRTIASALGLDADEAVMRLMREPVGGDESGARLEVRERLQRAAVVLVLVGLALSLWGVVSLLRGMGGEPAATPDVVYRPDVVRRLAEEVAAAPAPAVVAPDARPAAADAPGAPAALAAESDAPGPVVGNEGAMPPPAPPAP